MPTQPQPDQGAVSARRSLPEVHHKPCACSRDMISMDRVQIVLRCTDCRAPRITIIGSRMQMREVLDTIGPPAQEITGGPAPLFLLRWLDYLAAISRFTRCMSSDVSRET